MLSSEPLSLPKLFINILLPWTARSLPVNNELWISWPRKLLWKYITYLTIIRRRRSEYWWIFPETKSRGIFTNIHEPEANNCFSIITQVIIEIAKQRNVKFYHNLPFLTGVHTTLLAHKLNLNLNLNLNVSRNAFLNSRSEGKTFSLTFIAR